MGMMEDLPTGPVGVDTAVFIYFIEENRRYLPIILPLFAEADAGRRQLITSALTLMEVLVVPYRSGNRALADRYAGLLKRGRGIELIDLTREQMIMAAQLRATTSIKTPDALQVVAAIHSRCSAFVTNDRGLPDVPGLKILQLDAYSE